MKKGYFFIILLLSCAIFTGCIKTTPYTLTINPSLTATLNGTTNFTAAVVVPSTIDTQVNDTSTALVITGNSSDQFNFTDKIAIEITRYKGADGVFSIVEGQAGAAFIHNGIPDYALGGVVAITGISSNSITGYFSFLTASGINVTNGTFTVGKP